MTPAGFFAAPSGPSISRVHDGTTVSYHDSQAAIKPKHTLRLCKRTVVLGSFSHRDVAGVKASTSAAG